MKQATEDLAAAANELVQRICSGDPISVSRTISLVENDWPGTDELLQLLARVQRAVPVIGFTGPPGAGKSTLISAYIRALRSTGQRVAVVSVDPSSPASGGAILGDRLRMHEHQLDPAVFIRSVAARGHLGGLCRNIAGILQILAAAAWDVILLETVGTGQSETEVAHFAAVSVVVNTPGFGDGVQAIKAGILEIADVLVVNKCDLPGAPRVVRELQAMLELRAGPRGRVPIVCTNAVDGSGIAELGQAIADRLSTKTQLELDDRKH